MPPVNSFWRMFFDRTFHMGIFVYFHRNYSIQDYFNILFILELTLNSGTLHCGIRNCISKDLFYKFCALFFWETLWHKLGRYCLLTLFCFESCLIYYYYLFYLFFFYLIFISFYLFLLFLWINIVNNLKFVAGFTFISFSFRLARNRNWGPVRDRTFSSP